MDGFLAWLHILVLMDDIVLLATTRSNMIQKLDLLDHICQTHGMKINVGKAIFFFFFIGGNAGDKQGLCVNNVEVEPCEQYVYLESHYTVDGSTSTAIQVHAKAKMSHVFKCISFITKHNDVPFIVKGKVFDAALMSSIISMSVNFG